MRPEKGQCLDCGSADCRPSPEATAFPVAGLLLFPFSHTDWSIKYSQDEPVQPKYDTNAPDLYIPSMAYLTYVLLVGYVLGLRNAFSPDALAATASSALVWLVLELGRELKRLIFF